MWKQLSRRIRESFEKCNLLSNGQDVTIKQNDNKISVSPCRLHLLPCMVQSLFHKQPIVRKKQHVDVGKDREKHDKQEENCNTSSDFQQPYSLLGAMGWSGALVLGYVLSQRIWCKKFIIHENKSKLYKIEKPLDLVHLLPRIAEAQPLNNAIFSSAHHNVVENHNVKNHEISSDEALDAAIEGLSLAHEKVVGETENRRGVDCLSKNCNRQAVEHFLRASQLNNAPAAFNLGQCYELGIGTKQDFKKAAEWYQFASDRGHPTAMYNLGVFYAHGWGGLKANVARARHLFYQAAQLGQVDAQAAIDRDPSRKQIVEPSLIHKEDKGYIMSSIEHIINYKNETIWNIRHN